ncbi:MAG TPA: hypothetical protein VHA15_00990 [Burkholderiales bacterium]|jgi:hypothetical protein|nr:hypothetical protein [Burkholderiales bacterium]
MTSRLHFERFMKDVRDRSADEAPKQLALAGLHPEEHEDVGAVRLSRIEAAMKDARAARTDK